MKRTIKIDEDDLLDVLILIRHLDDRYLDGKLTASDWMVNGPGTIAPALNRLSSIVHFDWKAHA